MLSGYQSDPAAIKLLQELSVAPASHPPFTLTGGLLRYNGRIWLGDNKPLQLKVLSALHDSALGGHSGFPVTFSRVKKLFAWRGMKSDVYNYVAACSICLQAKPDRVEYPGLLVPLPVPSESWQVVSMNFIDGLPTSGTANCLMVVVDKFSKYAHFVPLHHPYNAPKVAHYSWTPFFVCMACLHISFLTVTRCSQAYSGRSSSGWPTSSYALVQLITRNPMVR